MDVDLIPTGTGSDRRHSLAIIVRNYYNTEADDCYILRWYDGNLNEYPYLYILKRVNGVQTILQEDTSSGIPSQPSTILGSIIGQALKVKADGAERTTSDSDITTGKYAGFNGRISGYDGGATLKVDDWTVVTK